MKSPETERLPPIEQWLQGEFSQQYDTQAKTLDKLGLLELLPESGTMGIRGIDGKEYPIPSKEQLMQEIRDNEKHFETKISQGFTRLQLTPLGVPLERLTMLLEQKIKEHFKQGKLLDYNNQPLELDLNQPLYVWDGWIDTHAEPGQKGADVTDKCLYYPKSFEQGQKQGQTKMEILQSQQGQAFAGWTPLLLESNLQIPAQGKGQTINGRKRIEANKTPIEYLELLLTNHQYAKEQGLTNEDWIILFLTNLEQTNQVIDDWEGQGKACYLLGSWNKVSRVLGVGCWSRGDRRANLYGDVPRFQVSGCGLRSAVGFMN